MGIRVISITVAESRTSFYRIRPRGKWRTASLVVVMRRSIYSAARNHQRSLFLLPFSPSMKLSIKVTSDRKSNTLFCYVTKCESYELRETEGKTGSWISLFMIEYILYKIKKLNWRTPKEETNYRFHEQVIIMI